MTESSTWPQVILGYSYIHTYVYARTSKIIFKVEDFDFEICTCVTDLGMLIVNKCIHLSKTDNNRST